MVSISIYVSINGQPAECFILETEEDPSTSQRNIPLHNLMVHIYKVKKIPIKNQWYTLTPFPNIEFYLHSRTLLLTGQENIIYYMYDFPNLPQQYQIIAKPLSLVNRIEYDALKSKTFIWPFSTGPLNPWCQTHHTNGQLYVSFGPVISSDIKAYTDKFNNEHRIRSETPHFQHILSAFYNGLMHNLPKHKEWASNYILPLLKLYDSVHLPLSLLIPHVNATSGKHVMLRTTELSSRFIDVRASCIYAWLTIISCGINVTTGNIQRKALKYYSEFKAELDNWTLFQSYTHNNQNMINAPVLRSLDGHQNTTFNPFATDPSFPYNKSTPVEAFDAYKFVCSHHRQLSTLPELQVDFDVPRTVVVDGKENVVTERKTVRGFVSADTSSDTLVATIIENNGRGSQRVSVSKRISQIPQLASTVRPFPGDPTLETCQLDSIQSYHLNTWHELQNVKMHKQLHNQGKVTNVSDSGDLAVVQRSDKNNEVALYDLKGEKWHNGLIVFQSEIKLACISPTPNNWLLLAGNEEIRLYDVKTNKATNITLNQELNVHAPGTLKKVLFDANSEYLGLLTTSGHFYLKKISFTPATGIMTLIDIDIQTNENVHHVAFSDFIFHRNKDGTNVIFVSPQHLSVVSLKNGNTKVETLRRLRPFNINIDLTSELALSVDANDFIYVVSQRTGDIYCSSSVGNLSKFPFLGKKMEFAPDSSKFVVYMDNELRIYENRKEYKELLFSIDVEEGFGHVGSLSHLHIKWRSSHEFVVCDSHTLVVYKLPHYKHKIKSIKGIINLKENNEVCRVLYKGLYNDVLGAYELMTEKDGMLIPFKDLYVSDMFAQYELIFTDNETIQNAYCHHNWTLVYKRGKEEGIATKETHVCRRLFATYHKLRQGVNISQLLPLNLASTSLNSKSDNVRTAFRKILELSITQERSFNNIKHKEALLQQFLYTCSLMNKKEVGQFMSLLKVKPDYEEMIQTLLKDQDAQFYKDVFLNENYEIMKSYQPTGSTNDFYQMIFNSFIRRAPIPMILEFYWTPQWTQHWTENGYIDKFKIRLKKFLGASFINETLSKEQTSYRFEEYFNEILKDEIFSTNLNKFIEYGDWNANPYQFHLILEKIHNGLYHDITFNFILLDDSILNDVKYMKPLVYLCFYAKMFHVDFKVVPSPNLSDFVKNIIKFPPLVFRWADLEKGNHLISTSRRSSVYISTINTIGNLALEMGRVSTAKGYTLTNVVEGESPSGTSLNDNELSLYEYL